MEKAFTDAVSFLVLPPAGPLLLAIAGLLLSRRRRRPGMALASGGIALLWVSSMGIVGNGLVRMLEPPPLARADLAQVRAIVVVGGGVRADAPEYGEAVAVNESLARARYAARLGRETGLPVLVSAGGPPDQAPEAEAIARIMKIDFGVEPRWLEKASLTTAQNASLSHAILSPVGITRIALVTTARHMPRAARAFRSVGFEVVPAPTGYTSREPYRLADFLPNAEALGQTRNALHEILGAAWYALRY
jgi:uncharacterized SAM-binding protein YcdF (DUF218 family)